MRRVEIERKSKVSPEYILEEHLRGIGKPVILCDATEKWKALSKWNFEHFAERYGSDPVVAWRGLRSGVGKLTTFSTYLQYLDNPSGDLSGIPRGEHADEPAFERGGEQKPPYYLLDWYAFRQHPELYSDIMPVPSCIPDWTTALSSPLKEVLERTSLGEFWAIYIGPKDSLSKLHRDFWNTHGYLAQIRGRKKAILFSPEDDDFVYAGGVNPGQPNADLFPLFERATAYECIIEPGDTLLIPARWWHHVVGLERSITVSHNFFNEVNFTQYLTCLMQNLPFITKVIRESPTWCAGLGIDREGWRTTDCSQ